MHTPPLGNIFEQRYTVYPLRTFTRWPIIPDRSYRRLYPVDWVSAEREVDHRFRLDAGLSVWRFCLVP